MYRQQAAHTTKEHNAFAAYCWWQRLNKLHNKLLLLLLNVFDHATVCRRVMNRGCRRRISEIVSEYR